MPQNLLHRLSFCEFVNEFVQVAYLLHQRIFDFFNANATHNALDKRTVRIDCWGFGKEGFKIVLLSDLLLQAR